MDRLFVVLKGPRRGQPLTPAGLDQILESARDRAGLVQATCHQLRHTPRLPNTHPDWSEPG